MKVAAPLQPPPSPEISADAKWHNRLGSLLSASKKYADAIAHFEQALVHAPRYAAAHFNLGSALVFDKGASMSHHIQRAVDHFRQAVDIQPHFPDAHVNLAAQLYAQGHFADALRHATTAISQDPDNIHAYYNLNTIYRALGQQDVAVELCWKRILSALLQPTTSRLVLSRPHDQQPEVVSHVHITVVCYAGWFGTLETDAMENERRVGGINSSVMTWHADKATEAMYMFLHTNFAIVATCIYKFDHWLEVQYPGQIVEYAHECQVQVPQNARLVCFPLEPKPHNATAPWVQQEWS
ncbi:hypothetical protein DYB28_004192 [Aphanomyces astaci]|uniref:O-GlcNAc transferase C-terminal domain-containing protein n=1 Tax=Aphanomyces astaci TaxID=112090 RepID=A0A9X8DKX9_APHAT|nr:hypothetical protein DYB28_004192 [Aphanomyces astaci]